MVPLLLGVPSMLNTGSGLSSFLRGNFFLQAKFWSMKTPPAPESTNPSVSMIWFSSWLLASCMGINMNFGTYTFYNASITDTFGEQFPLSNMILTLSRCNSKRGIDSQLQLWYHFE